MRLEHYQDSIKRVPKTTGRERVVVSSTYLWEKLISESPIIKKRDKKYLEPEETFFHLLQAD